MEENIKYLYARPGDYKEVQVPLSATVVSTLSGASRVPRGANESPSELKQASQEIQGKEELQSNGTQNSLKSTPEYGPIVIIGSLLALIAGAVFIRIRSTNNLHGSVFTEYRPEKKS
jgi:hypothetical protein